MERPPRYQPLSGDDEEEILTVLEEKESTAWNANSTEIIPTNTLSFVVYLSILLLSLSANVLLVLSNAKLRTSQAPQATAFSGLKFDTITTYHALTDYWRPNATDEDMEAAWDSINTDRMAVALEDKFAVKAGLPASTRFPWDTERSVYYLKGMHDLHCLKLVRKAIATKHRGDNQTFSLHHIYHCLEGLRQDIMCMADDTPMPALTGHHFGDGQVRKCRNWDRMVAWASESERHACYEWDDYREATNSLELFAHCPPGSPYRDFQQAYFAYHGHKDTYEVKDGGEPTIIF